MVTFFQDLLPALLCSKFKCRRIRSYLLSKSTFSFLKVNLTDGAPTGVSVTGRGNDSRTTTGKPY